MGSFHLVFGWGGGGGEDNKSIIAITITGQWHVTMMRRVDSRRTRPLHQPPSPPPPPHPLPSSPSPSLPSRLPSQHAIDQIHCVQDQTCRLQYFTRLHRILYCLYCTTLKEIQPRISPSNCCPIRALHLLAQSKGCTLDPPLRNRPFLEHRFNSCGSGSYTGCEF